MKCKGAVKAYLRIELIDLFDRRLNIARMDRGSNGYPCLNRLHIRLGLDVSLYCKFLRSSGVAIGDEVVHDQVIDVTAVVR